MKKVILSVLVAGSLLATSCKKAKEGAEKVGEGVENVAEGAAEATEGAANAVTEGAEKAVEGATEAAKGAIASVAGIDVPDFGNEEVNAYVKSYAEYAKEYIDAKGDVMKSGLATKAQELAKQSQSITGKLDAEGTKKLADFMTKISEKMTAAAGVK